VVGYAVEYFGRPLLGVDGRPRVEVSCGKAHRVVATLPAWARPDARVVAVINRVDGY
jgi:hypothetical protein